MAKNNSKKSKALVVVVIILVIVALALGITLMLSIVKNDESVTEEAISTSTETDNIQTEENTADKFIHPSDFMIIPDEQGNPIAQINVDINNLKELNGDACGWIYIPETGINCAIVCNEISPDYYLSNDIDKVSGVFLQNYNSNDFTDRMTVVYGKNQNGKSQFEGLFKYMDKAFFEGHKYVYIATEDKILTYKIFAARKAYAEHLMLGYDWSEDQVFLDYLIYTLDSGEIAEQTDVETALDIDPNANIDFSADISVNDRVITLSQRIDGEDDYRYLVQGVLINESIKEAP